MLFYQIIFKNTLAFGCHVKKNALQFDLKGVLCYSVIFFI
jgi:hypothetical protein